MDASSRVLNHDQTSGRNEEMRRALRGLSRTFQRNPRYRGRTFADVRDELREEAIAAQVRRRRITAQAPASPETGAELARLDAEWAPFGGPNWATMLASDVAGQRFNYEQEAEFCRRPNYTVDRWQRDRDRWARSVPRTPKTPSNVGRGADLQKLFSFNGRVGRGAYWATTVISAILVLWAAGYLLSDNPNELVAALVGVAAALAYVIWLATSVKRWHDRDKPGGWVLIYFVPIVGGIWGLIEQGFLRGTDGANEYGPPNNGAPFRR